MGNCCSDNKHESTVSKIVQPQSKPGFYLSNYQSKFTPASFAQIPQAEKDALIAEVLRLIAQNGDLSKVKTNNATIKQFLAKTHSKIELDGTTFDGETIDGLASGKGRVQYNGTFWKSYEGEFQHGREHGQGTYVVGAGDKIITQTNYDGQVEGLCDVVFANGDKGQCNFVKDQANGPSVIQGRDGVIFDTRVNDKIDGLRVGINHKDNVVVLTDYRNDAPAKSVTYVPDMTVANKVANNPHGSVRTHQGSVQQQPARIK